MEIENFRSLRGRQELSMVATKLSGPTRGLQQVGETPVVPVAAIYGANASGKSNVLKAIRFLANAVKNSHSRWEADGAIPLEPFALARTKEASDASFFEVDFSIGKVRYTYGCRLSQERVLEEWLRAFPNGRRQEWFHRDGDKFKFGRSLSGRLKLIQSLTRPNSLFLSAAAQNNHPQLTKIYDWFGSIHWVGGDRMALAYESAVRCEKPIARRILSNLVAAADLGIVGIEFENEELTDDMKSLINSIAKVGKVRQAAEEMRGIPKISLRHRARGTAQGVPLPFRDESAGTVAWLGLLTPLLDAINFGGVLLVDELDASLHPLITQTVVRTFSDRKENDKGAQLIFNTHDTNLLDPDLLRRDQIWFVEKDKSGESHLYALTDFNPRVVAHLGRGYVQGRYGAIPFIQSRLLSSPSPTQS